MGGRDSIKLPRSPTPTKDVAPGSGGGGSAPPDRCPSRLDASVAGPVPGIATGSWLDVVVRGTGAPRVVLVDSVSGQTVGALSGVPNLAILIECLLNGVVYRAFVTTVSGGRVDIAIVKQ